MIRLPDLSRLAPYAKTVVAVGAFLGVLGNALTDGSISGDEVELLVTAFGAIGVFGVRNA